MSKAGSSSRGAASYLVRRLKTSSSSSSSAPSVPSGSSTPSSLSSSPSSSSTSTFSSGYASPSTAAGRLSYYYDAALSHDHPLAESIVAEWTLPSSTSRASSTESTSASASAATGTGYGHGWPAGGSALYQGNAHRARRRVPTTAAYQQRHQSTQSQSHSHSHSQTSAPVAAGSGYTNLRPSFWASASSREPAQEQPPQHPPSSSSSSSPSSPSSASIFSPLLFGSASTSASTSSSSGSSTPSGVLSSASGILPAISSFISPSSPSPQPSPAPSSAATASASALASPLARFGDARGVRVPQQPAVQGSSKAPQLTLHHGAFGIPKRPKQAPTPTPSPPAPPAAAKTRVASIKGKERAAEADQAALDRDAESESESDAALLEKQLQELEGPLLSVQVGEDAYFVRHDSLGVADGVGGWAGRQGADPGLFAARLMHHCSAELAASLHDDRSTGADAGAEESAGDDAAPGKSSGNGGPQFSFVSASSSSASAPTAPSSSSLRSPTPANAVAPQVSAHSPTSSSRDAPDGNLGTAAAAASDTADQGQAHAQLHAHADSLESRLLASDPIELLHRAWDLTLTEFFDLSLTGSSTALVALLSGDELRVANLGDCSCSIIRGNPPEYIFRSQEQQHSFNYPFQAGTNSQDTPRKDGQRFNIKVRKGDIVILSSDGLVDNLFDEDILEEVEAFCPPPLSTGSASEAASSMSASPPAGGSTSDGMDVLGEETEATSGEATVSPTHSRSSRQQQNGTATVPTAGAGTIMASLNPQELSQALCARAKAVSEDQQAVASPFQQRANEEGIHFVGGKHDDISVLVAVIGDKA